MRQNQANMRHAKRKQLELVLRTWGGKRRGAGRKPKGPKPGVPHRQRPALAVNSATHVTLRVCRDITNLRTKERVRALRQCLARGCAKNGFRVVHYSVQGTHLHLVIEADSRKALASGMNGLGTRLGRRLNALAAGRSGRVFADRYHAHVLRTPREVREALAYVLLNRTRHLRQRGRRLVRPGPDPFSSAALFDGWRDAARGPPATDEERGCVAGARSWLLRTGWRRHGLIGLEEVPGSGR
jgi:REP element-mobilizing transposase RayT